MLKNRISAKVLLLIMIVVCLGSNSRASVIIKKNEFTIILPNGWTEIPEQILNDAQQEFKATVKGNAPDLNVATINYGFKLGSIEKGIDLPHILVIITYNGRISEETKKTLPQYDVSKELNNVIEGLKPITNLTIGEFVYDEKNDIIWCIMEASSEDGNKICCLMGCVPTKNGMIQFLAKSTKNTFGNYLPDFIKAITSVSLSPALANKSESEKNLDDTKKPTTTRKMGAYEGEKKFISYVFIGVIAVLIILWKRRKSITKDSSGNEPTQKIVDQTYEEPSKEIKALCPSCSAPVKSTDSNCQFCSRKLTPK